MSPIERVLFWIWDRRGHRRAEIAARQLSMERNLRNLRGAELRALDQVQRTQAFVRAHREQFR